MHYKKIVYLFLVSYTAIVPAIIAMESESVSPCMWQGRELQRIKRIAQGSFGNLFLEQDSDTQKLLACKYCCNAEFYLYHIKEIALVSRLPKSPFIVEHYSCGLSKESPVLVMEYLAKGDLFGEVMRYRNGLREDRASHYFVQLMLGLFVLHQRNILHRDIKLENLLIDPYGILKLCDFGFAREYADVNAKNLDRDIFGSDPYVAPEIWQYEGHHYSCKSDVWAAAVVLYCMLTQEAFFSSTEKQQQEYRQDIRRQALKGPYPKLSACFSLDMRNLIDALLIKDPDKRPTAFQILCMPYMQRCLVSFLRHVNSIEDAELKHSIAVTVDSLLFEMQNNNIAIIDELINWWGMSLTFKCPVEAARREKTHEL